MTFKKGYIQTASQQKKSKESRGVRFGESQCVSCGVTFTKYQSVAKTCGNQECIRIRRVSDYKKFVEENPVEGKALKLFSTVRLGQGKKQKALQILTMALGKPCKYCGTQITLENASVDHKIPRTGSKVYSRKTKKMAYSYEEISKLDSEENLHIICRKCNGLKGEFTDNEFSRLLDFLKRNEDIKVTLFKRLRTGFLSFGHK